jgi:signal peptidase II
MRLRLAAFGIAAVVFVFDQITKIAIRGSMPELDVRPVIPGFFDIVHAENPGAAFSFFAHSPAQWRNLVLVLIAAAALVFISVLLWRAGGRIAQSPVLRAGMALIMGGALGNVYDRIVHGTVTDFLDVYVRNYHWPAFNVADSAITVGAVLVLWDTLRASRAAEVK